MSAIGSATRATTVLTRCEGSGGVLGLCLPAQSVPTLVRDHDGLRRSPSLPRALCEPVPPGPPGEIQGLAARRALVAPQPARPARRLSGRLRPDLPEQEHLPLPRVPARGPCLLDLLLGLTAVGLALHGRQCGADPEGALPASARRILDGRDPGGH